MGMVVDGKIIFTGCVHLGRRIVGKVGKSGGLAGVGGELGYGVGRGVGCADSEAIRASDCKGEGVGEFLSEGGLGSSFEGKREVKHKCL